MIIALMWSSSFQAQCSHLPYLSSMSSKIQSLQPLTPRRVNFVQQALLERISNLCSCEMQKQLHMALWYANAIAKISRVKKSECNNSASCAGDHKDFASYASTCDNCKSFTSTTIFPQYTKATVMILQNAKALPMILWAVMVNMMIERVKKATLMIPHVVKANMMFL